MCKFFGLLILMSSTFANGQDKGELSIQFCADRQYVQMNNTNNILLDESQLTLGEFNLPRVNELSNGLNLSSRLTYQFLNNWSFGVYGNFQSVKIKHYDGFSLEDDFGNINDTMGIQRNYSATSISFGITSRLSINNLLRLEKKSGILNRLLLGLNLGVGYGLSTFKVVDYWSLNDKTIFEKNQWNYNSKGFQSKIGLDFGFILLKKSVISSIGLNLGYQRYVTDNLSTRQGATFLNTGQYANLDFSGLYFGGNLTLGR